MKLAVAQIRPVVGPIEQNIDLHLALTELGAKHGANLIVFPELSLTGYEPSIAADLCRSSGDTRFTAFQDYCDRVDISICVGFPLRTDGLPHISALVFHPKSNRKIYSKQYLHADEQPFFSSGINADSMILEDPQVSLSICYELSISEHAQAAFTAGATAYIASVAKTGQGVEAACSRLSEIATEHAAIVMMSNCVGYLDGADCVGRSSVWGRSGNLLAQLDEHADGVIVVDFESEDVTTDTLSHTGRS